MGIKEKEVEQELQIEGSKAGFSIFRNNVGLFFSGVWDKKLKVIKNPRPVKCGLYKGSGDYIGFKEIEITEDMVGKKVAVFCSVEAKSSNGRERPGQKKWRDNISRFNGFACVAKCSEDLMKDWDLFLERLKAR